jgi:hypothetical protein
MAAQVKMKAGGMGTFYIFKRHGSEEGSQRDPSRDRPRA